MHTDKHVKHFGAYSAVFDGNDDDNGDGQPDLLANPVVVAYQLNATAPKQSGEYAEPDISIKRPNDWYKSPEFAFLWQPIKAKSRLDHSYDGIGRIWRIQENTKENRYPPKNG